MLLYMHISFFRIFCVLFSFTIYYLLAIIGCNFVLYYLKYYVLAIIIVIIIHDYIYFVVARKAMHACFIGLLNWTEQMANNLPI